jgi:Na+-transporting NADH:ubiquinone oxidoreductase subunit NqrD
MLLIPTLHDLSRWLVVGGYLVFFSLDYKELKNNDYEINFGIRLLAVLLPPVWLFYRASKTNYAYGYAILLSVFIALIIAALLAMGIGASTIAQKKWQCNTVVRFEEARQKTIRLRYGHYLR